MAAELVADCPRCGAKSITFSILESYYFKELYQWQRWFETFSRCRNCHRATIFILRTKNQRAGEFLKKQSFSQMNASVNEYVDVEGFINLKDVSAASPPDHLPEDIDASFREGATCLAVECFNAAGAMFRLCIDLTTKPMLPPLDQPPPNKVRRNLGLRLPWLFDNGKLPEALRELSECVKEDGNDGAHDGTLKKEDAEDLRDFTSILLERIYTEPERLRLAQLRRDKRRNPDVNE